MKGYRGIITEIMVKQGIKDVPASQVEAFMRVEHGTLDALSRGKFEVEVQICSRMAQENPNLAASIARSYGY